MNVKPEILECGHPPIETKAGIGYGTDSKGARLCSVCCAEIDREIMRKDGRIMLYLQRTINPYVTNWAGSLSFPVIYVNTGMHNICGFRYDFWFSFENHEWHGVQYGDNPQAHCRRNKTP